MVPLNWGLVIITYNRPRVLALTVKLALEQTRPPSEVVIIDASDDWDDTRRMVEETVQELRDGIRWVYEPAEVRSTTHQRNQGVARAQADVLFLIDDDSWMFPDCAEKVMAVYEDPDHERILGIQCGHVMEMPIELEGGGSASKQQIDGRKRTGMTYYSSIKAYLRSSFIGKFFVEQVLLLGKHSTFIPYYGGYRSYPEDKQLKAPLRPVQLISGSGMTFRRYILEKEPFETALRYSAAFEDCELSYRVRHHGLVVLHPDAKLHHYKASSGRVSRRALSEVSLLNRTVFIKFRSTNRTRDYFRLSVMAMRTLVAEFLKDGLTGRLTFPQVRGTLAAIPNMFRMAMMPQDKVRPWYADLQKRIVER